MKHRVAFTLVIAIFVAAACIAEPAEKPLSAAERSQRDKAVAAAKQAIAAQPAKYWGHGADYDAWKLDDGSWMGRVWRIEFPDKHASERFVPGGFRDIHVGKDGKVIGQRPGLRIQP